jgi:hypothetical protein
MKHVHIVLLSVLLLIISIFRINILDKTEYPPQILVFDIEENRLSLNHITISDKQLQASIANLDSTHSNKAFIATKQSSAINRVEFLRGLSAKGPMYFKFDSLNNNIYLKPIKIKYEKMGPILASYQTQAMKGSLLLHDCTSKEIKDYLIYTIDEYTQKY